MKSFLKPLIDTDAFWDAAILSFKDRQDTPIIKSDCNIKIEDDCLIVEVAQSTYPFGQGTTAKAEHYFPLDNITGVIYFTENKIQTSPGLIKV